MRFASTTQTIQSSTTSRYATWECFSGALRVEIHAVVKAAASSATAAIGRFGGAQSCRFSEPDEMSTIAGSPKMEPLDLPLDNVRTDGWFERIGEGISAFQALCDIVGERFFAFSVIIGARITSLVIDRQNPDLSIVDFVLGEQETEVEPQRLTLGDFRRRLVGALLVEDDRDDLTLVASPSVDEIQLFIGVRYLLLAPLYGYSLRRLVVERNSRRGGSDASIVAMHEGQEEVHPLLQFRQRIRSFVREEVERVASGRRNAIDLAKVAEAEVAFEAGDMQKVIALLGSWPAPLAIFWRQPEGQMLSTDARGLIAKGLGFLGTACARQCEVEQAEEVFRLGIQYAQEGLAAAELFLRLGDAMLASGRPGEAIGALRRALAFGMGPRDIMPRLSLAFVEREKFVAAYACVRAALEAGVPELELVSVMRRIESALGQPLTAWKTRALGTG